MTLVKTKIRPKTSAERKRQGLHHRQTRNYTKSYWPYIPILTVFFLGALLNIALGSNSKSLGANVGQPLSNSSGLSGRLLILALVIVIAVCLYALIHGTRVRRAITKSESIITKHYVIDACLAMVIVIGYVLVRTN
jgi:hypothetical protein